jgi:uncharacterized protein (DUF4415 family)
MNKKNTVEKYGTDIEALRQMKDEDIDFSDIPPLTEEMFERGFVYKNFEPIATSKQTAVPIFNDVVEFFRKRQVHYTFEIDRVLRDYIAAEIAREKEADK